MGIMVSSLGFLSSTVRIRVPGSLLFLGFTALRLRMGSSALLGF